MKKILLTIAFLIVGASPAYASNIHDGLIGQWRFDEGTGSTTADTIGGNTGTLTGGTGPVWTSGKVGPYALSFDGSASYVDVADTSLLSPSAVTVSVWVNPSSLSNAYTALVSKVTPSFSGYYQIFIKSTGKLAMYVVGGSGSVSYDGTGSVTLSTGTWYHIVMTYDSVNGLVGYVNGSVDGTAAAAGTMVTTAGVDLSFGKDLNTSGRILSGSLDEVCLWNRALTASDVTLLYGTKNGDCAPTPVTYNLTDCGQNTVAGALASSTAYDTVVCPAGTWNWYVGSSTQYSNSILVPHVTLQTSSKTSSSTVINDLNTDGNQHFLIAASGNYDRISGFTFYGTCVTTYFMVYLQGNMLRADRNWFVNNCGNEGGISARYSPLGAAIVVDHNTFVNQNNGVECYGLDLTGSDTIEGKAVHGNASWASSSPISSGTGAGVYMEDNTFNSSLQDDGATEAYGGCSYVFRHNTVIGTLLNNHGFDSGPYRSTYTWEIYNNTFTNPGTALFTTMTFRGGSGVIYNNTVVTGYNGFIRYNNFRSSTSTWVSPLNNWDGCDGTGVADQNTGCQWGYACRDQIGRGVNQTLVPAYEWNNNYQGNMTPTSGVCGYDCPEWSVTNFQMISGRDYYDNVASSTYTAYTYPYPLITQEDGVSYSVNLAGGVQLGGQVTLP